MKRWTEGYVHLRMRQDLKSKGFRLVAGEYPGGSDHELYPLNVVDPVVARDGSPDPRRHSFGELIPDILALRGRYLVIGEAKVDYSDADRIKLQSLIMDRRSDLFSALEKFSSDRRVEELLPLDTLTLLPTLIFTDRRVSPIAGEGMSHIIVSTQNPSTFVGKIEEALVE